MFFGIIQELHGMHKTDLFMLWRIFFLRAIQWEEGTTELKVSHQLEFKGGQGRFGQKIFCFNGSCHIVGASSIDDPYCKDQVWNLALKTMETVKEFPQWNKELTQYSAIHNDLTKELYILGGKHWNFWGGDFENFNGDILVYNECIKVWEKSEKVFRPKRFAFGSSLAKGGLLLVVGGCIGSEPSDYGNDPEVEVNSNEIWISDVKEMQFVKSAINLPYEAQCETIIMENEEEHDLVVKGWIRKQQQCYGNIINVPLALQNLIKMYNNREYLHVFLRKSEYKLCGDYQQPNWQMQEINAEWEHWGISVDKIVGC